MTERKHFKQLVRTRMSKTGESYTAARRQLDTTAAPHPGGSSPTRHFAGSIPIATAFRALLTRAGVRHPGTGAPLSEAMVFGLGGGIGAGVFAFHYAKDNFSSFYIAGRHLWHDDLGWAKGLAKRLGLQTVIKESGGAKAGETQLRELLEGGRPVVAWVDAASLPHRAMPESWSGGAYHLVTIHGIRDDDGTALMGDLSDELIPIALTDLAAARARIKKFKNRLLALEPAARPVDLAGAVPAAIHDCVESLVTCRMKNYKLDAFANWAAKLDGSKGADSWEKMFRPGPLMYQGLQSVTEFIDYYGGKGLCRPAFARFLEEAGTALSDRALTRAAARYAELGKGWSALAEAALPDRIPAFRETRRLFARRAEARARGLEGREEAAACWQALKVQGEKMRTAFPLNEAESAALRRDLKKRVMALYEEEVAALGELGVRI